MAFTVLVMVAASILWTFVNDYGPVTYGLDATGGLRYPGLPSAHGVRTVNNFGHFREDFYIPPQRGTFYLFVSILNTGTRAVTVEKVSLPKLSPLFLAGPVRYGRPSGPGTSGIGPAKHILHNVRLGAYKEIFLALPVHSWPCTKMRISAWSAVPRFYVSYRFMFFHAVAALPWGFKDEMLIMHTPSGRPRRPGVYCAK
ncbi:MAG: hypothetical protein LBV34_02030 [Nocardiopsaceae bacterium]|nr:hypothetical protein [Nocardiopsaceae bacterium]